MPVDSTLQSHQEWLGFVQPVGVVVSTPALLQAGAAINCNFVPLHRDFLALLPIDRDGNPVPELRNFRDFVTSVLNWRPNDLQAPPESFTISVAGYDDLLRPTSVVRDGSTPVLLVQELAAETTADELDLEYRRRRIARRRRHRCGSNACCGKPGCPQACSSIVPPFALSMRPRANRAATSHSA